ncbi:hypothetical protein BKK49_02555 [Rodentibacter rarus]|uniref:Uncharacterized protein n=2 Tax=Rodentibacter rarus TaxID=1908260 RepID=A0A1V3IMF3_9PAST|nr:SEL1-like repeat protein [Rodentibacter rarus]OOF42418.1 hypothetical protein BKK49_02555 [Rodentibacter rarus]OOF43190.1 hypothetical protein BKK50_05330 [Rodentibacter rarus]
MNILNKLKTRKKSVLAVVIITIAVIVWNSISYKTQLNILSQLGSVNAKYELISDLVYGYKISCEELKEVSDNGYNIPRYNALGWLMKIYIDAAKSGNKSARSNLLKMANGKGGISRRLIGCEKDDITASQIAALIYLNELFEKNPTGIEDWSSSDNIISYSDIITSGDIISYYLNSSKWSDTKSLDYQYYAQDLIDKKVELYKNDFLKNKDEQAIKNLLDLAYLAKNTIEETAKEIYQLVLLMGDKEQKKEAEFYLAMLSYDSHSEMDKQDGLNKMQSLASENYSPALVFLGDDIKRYSDNNSLVLARAYYEKARKFFRWQNREYTRRNILTKIYHTYSQEEKKYMYHLLEIAECGKRSTSVWDADMIYCSLDLANIYFEVGKYDEARTIYEEILIYDNTNMHSLSHLAEIYYKGLGVRQDLEKAKEYYGKLCDLKEQKYCDLFREVNEKIR